MEDKVQKAINGAIDRLNELMPAGGELSKDAATVLLGRDALLDSMGFVNLVVMLEEEIEKQFGCQVNLSDELAAKPEIRTIGELHQALIRVVRLQKPAAGLTPG
jgi:acyl carrier protein